MRLPVLVIGFLLAALSPAFAATYETPTALLKALYGNTPVKDEDWPHKSYYSDHLNALIQKDQDTTQPGEQGSLDFDPVIAGQDGEASEVKIGKPSLSGETANVVVTFRNFDPVTLNYTLVKEHGGWKIDDIAHPAGEFSWSLRAIFQPAQ